MSFTSVGELGNAGGSGHKAMVHRVVKWFKWSVLVQLFTRDDI